MPEALVGCPVEVPSWDAEVVGLVAEPGEHPAQVVPGDARGGPGQAVPAVAGHPRVRRLEDVGDLRIGQAGEQAEHEDGATGR